MNSQIFNYKVLFIHSLKKVNITLIYDQNIYYSLLSLLSCNHIPIPYQCKSGYCGSCRIILISGKIKYKKEPLVYTTNYSNNSEILSCCCYPTSNLILTF